MNEPTSNALTGVDADLLVLEGLVSQFYYL